MATEEQIDAIRRRLHASRTEIVHLAGILRGGAAPPAVEEPRYRSHLMRALTGQPARSIGKAALALTMSRPRAVWRLSNLLPLLRPVLRAYLSQRFARSRRTAST